MSWSQLRSIGDPGVPFNYVAIPARVSIGVVIVSRAFWDRQTFAFRQRLSRVIKDAALKSTILFDVSPFNAFTPQPSWMKSVELVVDDFSQIHDRWIELRPADMREIYREYLRLIKIGARRGAVSPFDEGDMERWPERGVIKFVTDRVDAGEQDLSLSFSDGRAVDVSCGRIEYSKHISASQGLDLDQHVRIVRMHVGNGVMCSIRSRAKWQTECCCDPWL